jgi:glycosyltransferase involved in cell wall biosynthesis
VKIDIIIPTYNRASVLEKAIQSVLKQTYQNFLLHIVDDGSTDETSSLLRSFDNHPQICIHTQKNLGVSAARNFGVKNSQNEWIAFLDSDDEWLPHKLEVQVDYLKKHPGLRFLHAEEIWIRNGVRVNPKAKHSKSQLDLISMSLEFCLISPSTVIMKRELFNAHHGFSEELEVCEDFDLWNKILLTEDVGFLDQFVTNKYGGHADQLSTKFVAMDYWRIKSLLNLRNSYELSPVLKETITTIIKKKASILLKGYQKHNNVEKHDEILALTSHL